MLKETDKVIRTGVWGKDGFWNATYRPKFWNVLYRTKLNIGKKKLPKQLFRMGHLNSKFGYFNSPLE